MDIGGTAQKWALAIVGLVVLAYLGTALFPMITDQFKAEGGLDNATGNGFTSLLGSVPTLMIVIFVIALILGVVGMLAFRKNR